MKNLILEHKVNITVHHLSGSVFVRGNEIGSIVLSQFLGSLETRPGAHAYKLSARAENLVIEGATSDQGLIPLLSVATGSGDFRFCLSVCLNNAEAMNLILFCFLP